jgi:hypothetical protein
MKISTNWTFFIKFIHLPIYTLICIRISWVSYKHEWPFLWIVLPAAMISAVYTIVVSAPLMEVTVNGSQCEISNFFKKIVIPASEIEGITRRTWPKKGPTVLVLKHPTAFGRKISLWTAMSLEQLHDLRRANPSSKHFELDPDTM